jgi:hypothetical protein
MRHIPTEIIDVIIDFLHSDKRALSVCSLVCRNWLPASQFHLFRIVHVRSSNVHSVINLLASPSSTVIRHVHVLHIYLPTHADMTPVFDTIAPYLREFVSVKTISLRSWRWLPVREESLFREFGRIGNMELTRVFYDFSTPWMNLTFTLGDSGPSTFSSCLRTLCTITHSRFPDLWIPMVMQLHAIGNVEMFYFRERQLPSVLATIKSGGESIHTVKLGCKFIGPSHLGTFKRL